MTVKEITKLRKEGRLAQALEFAEKEFEKHPSELTATTVFWCLYDISRSEDTFYEKRPGISERMVNLRKEFFQNDERSGKALDNLGWDIYRTLKDTPYNQVLKRKRLLLQYLNLNLSRPSLLHSLILSEALKLKKASPSQFRLKDFLALWGLEYLRDDDWVKFRPEKGHSPNSLVENLVGSYVKELQEEKRKKAFSKDEGPKGSDDVPEEFDLLIDKALQTYRSNPHLPIYKAQLLALEGRREEALEHYVRLLRRWPKKFFLWTKAEALVPYRDIDLRIALLCKAIMMVRDEAFLGDIRLRLANLLYKKGLYANAKYELERYTRYYISHHWHPRRWAETIEARIKESASDTVPEPTPYAQYATLADNYIAKQTGWA